MGKMLSLAILTIAIAASGCSPTVVDTSCTAFGVITFSASQDSAETVARVREHNAAWRSICAK